MSCHLIGLCHPCNIVQEKDMAIRRIQSQKKMTTERIILVGRNNLRITSELVVIVVVVRVRYKRRALTIASRSQANE